MYFELDKDNKIISIIEIEIEGVISPMEMHRFVKASTEDVKIYLQSSNKYRPLLVWDGKRLSESQALKLLKAKDDRKVKEQYANIEFLGRLVKADDKAVSMLQAYIGSTIESVMWKCVDGWLELDKEGMSLLLGEILAKKASLFEDEHASQV